MKTKITLIGVNFYPEDSAIGLYSTQMMEFLSNCNYSIDVITGFPYYPQWEIKESYKTKPKFVTEKFGNINIYRYKQFVPKSPNFFKRIIHLLDFTVGCLFNLRKIKETDIIIVIVPFTSSIFLGWLLKKKTKAKLWAHIQDFEFDAALQTGLSNKKSKGIKKWVFNLIFKLEKWLFSKVDAASSISYLMVEKLKLKLSDKTHAFYFPNWIDTQEIIGLEQNKHPYLSSNKFKILYSGNIGEKQDWDFFLNFIDRLDTNTISVIVVGDGSKKEWLVEKTKNYKIVKHYPPIPYKNLSNLLNSADLHILFQKEDVIDTVMPSKLLGMMASKKPSLITGNLQSEVKRVIDESKGGIYSSKNEINEILKKINILINNLDHSKKMGENARNYILKKYDKKSILESFKNEIEKL